MTVFITMAESQKIDDSLGQPDVIEEEEEGGEQDRCGNIRLNRIVCSRSTCGLILLCR